MKEFVEEYSTPFLNDKRFSFHFHPIFGMKELRLTKEEQLKELEELAKTKGFMYDDPSAHALCYAARADSFVIRANGKVQKCTVALNSDINTVGKINADGTMDLDQEKLKKWLFADNTACPLQSLALEKLAVPYEGAGEHLKATPSVLQEKGVGFSNL